MSHHLISSFSFSFSLSSATLENCDVGKTTGTFKSFAVSPNPPVKGQALHFSALGNVTKAYADVPLKLDVKYSGITLFSHTGDACGTSSISLPLGEGTIAINGLTCPTTAGGAMDFALDVTLPKSVPSGAYVITVTGSSGSDEVFCIEGDFSL